MQHNQIADRGAMMLAQMAQSARLERLDLAGNEIKEPGGLALAKALELSKSLKTVSMFGNGVGMVALQALRRTSTPPVAASQGSVVTAANRRQGSSPRGQSALPSLTRYR